MTNKIKKIVINKPKDKMIGFRVPNDVYEKIEIIAKKNKVSLATIVGHIITEVIDNYE